MNKYLSSLLLAIFYLLSSIAFATLPDQTITSDPEIKITKNINTIVAYFDDEGTLIKKPAIYGGTYRKLLGQIENSWYVVQDFYQQNHTKKTEPFLINNVQTLKENSLESIEGRLLYYYQNGQKKFDVTLKNGEMDGISTVWYENGQKKSEDNYINGQLSNRSTTWYENGQKQAEYIYKHDKNRTMDILFISWYKNGQKKEEINLLDGHLPDGHVITWYENGQKETETYYRKGQTDGLCKTWDENGERKVELNCMTVTVSYPIDRVESEIIKKHNNQ